MLPLRFLDNKTEGRKEMSRLDHYRSQPPLTPVEFLMVVFVIVTLPLVFFRGTFVDSSIAIRALEKQGYENISIVKEDRFFAWVHGCDARDAARFAMKATNPAKKEVELSVCAGWPLKGATIRTD